MTKKILPLLAAVLAFGPLAHGQGFIPAPGATLAQGANADTAEQPANKGVANGYAGLDSTARVPVVNLPAFAMIPAAPTISENPTSGQVTLSYPADGAATIYYTTDGSTPAGSSTRYTGPFTLTGGTITVKAVAYLAPSGPVASVTYLIAAQDAEVTAWVGRITAAGGTITTSERSIFDAFIKSIKAAGVRTKIFLYNPYVPSSYVASQVPFINDYGTTPAWAYTGFTSADYSATTGLAGSAGGKFVNTNTNLVTAGQTASSFSYFARLTTGYTDSNATLMSTLSGGLGIFPFYVGASRCYGPSVNFAGGTITNAMGVHIWSRVSGTDSRVYINGTQSGSTTTGSETTSPPNANLQLYYAANYNANWFPGATTCLGAGLGLTSSDAANLTTAINTQETALGR